ncbi:helix-turn-helix domain-containing protein [Natranaerobius trueperi]|uniref:Transcriptional regulator n=1 Tax=Natranaerobius trueperi TaxID=759412 RepID=A0A226BYF0_9FIRM|nr:helix-turn-helix transcriptional regulator [Natranaerobius trueperi]OWZ83364.1 transcriptional regulator [Natranaerobius trueperi]
MTNIGYTKRKGVNSMLSLELAGKRFQELRSKSGLTQSQIAKYLEVDQSYISKCEKGERQFTLDILERAADLFGCTVTYFTEEDIQHEPLALAFRAEEVEADDLQAIAAIRKIALNLRYMEDCVAEAKK